MAEVVGVVSQSKGNLVVLPRSKADVKKTGVSQRAVIEKQEEQEDREDVQVQLYLLTTAGGITAILIGLLLRQYGPIGISVLKKRFAILNKE